MSTIRVLVSGAGGRMGQEVCRAVDRADDLLLVAAVDVQYVGEPLGQVAGIKGCELQVQRSLSDAIAASSPDVVVDFTQPYSRYANFRATLDGGARPVVGTTGWTPQDLSEAEQACREAGLGAVIAPNFAIGAILMMRFAAMAAKHMPSVEIVELHHDAKLDAPSGTAAKTAALIAEARRAAGVHPPQPEGVPDTAARGLDLDQVRIHSVRLPGLLAHQETLFGGLGQTLSIRHDTISRESFMPGVLLACRRVMALDGLVYGLEALLD